MKRESPSPSMGQELQRMLDTYFRMVRQVSMVLNFKSKDVTVGEARILEFVQEMTECAMGDLIRQFPIPGSTATRYVDKLVQKGYLQRKSSEEDRRRVLLKLSKKGTELLDKRNEIRNKFFHKMFSRLTSKDIADLERIFGKLIIDK